LKDKKKNYFDNKKDTRTSKQKIIFKKGFFKRPNPDSKLSGYRYYKVGNVQNVNLIPEHLDAILWICTPFLLQCRREETSTWQGYCKQHTVNRSRHKVKYDTHVTSEGQ
jgi:hypothetical protein